jgi:hypothetical protein
MVSEREESRFTNLSSEEDGHRINDEKGQDIDSIKPSMDIRGAVGGSSCSPEIAAPPREIEWKEEFIIRDEDVIQWHDWCDPEEIQASAVPAARVGLAVEEQRKHQEELIQRFMPLSEVTVSQLKLTRM